ncbi:MAG: hypothetical protein UMV23_05650 [Halanaerobium sp.]|nr:hypothetical protein [Halanaerobium sp.]
MDTSIANSILAVVVTRAQQNKVSAGGAPLFICDSREELEEVTMLLARLTMSMVHDLRNGVYILIKH